MTNQVAVHLMLFFFCFLRGLDAVDIDLDWGVAEELEEEEG